MSDRDTRTCSYGHTWLSIRAVSTCPQCGEKVELPMAQAMTRGECYITPDRWCATHSTRTGPVYCQPPADHEQRGASEKVER